MPTGSERAVHSRVFVLDTTTTAIAAATRPSASLAAATRPSAPPSAPPPPPAPCTHGAKGTNNNGNNIKVFLSRWHPGLGDAQCVGAPTCEACVHALSSPHSVLHVVS